MGACVKCQMPVGAKDQLWTKLKSVVGESVSKVIEVFVIPEIIVAENVQGQRFPIGRCLWELLLQCVVIQLRIGRKQARTQQHSNKQAAHTTRLLQFK